MKRKNNSPINIYELQQYKLDGYFDELPEQSSRKEYIEDKIEKLDSNLIVWKSNNMYHLKQKRVYCPECYSKDINEKGYYSRSLLLMDYGLVDCKIKRYKCKHCRKDFSADISSIVNLILPCQMK